MNNPASPPPIDPISTGPKWPTTIGIIGIVLGIAGILNVLLQLVGFMFTKTQMNALVASGIAQEDVDAWLAKFLKVSYISMAIMTVLGIILLVGAIFLLKRKKKSVPLLKIWALGKIVAAFVITFLTRPISQEQIAMMTSSNDAFQGNGESFSKMMDTIMGASFILGLVWLCALPIFFLIWFTRRKIKQDVEDFS